MVKLEYESARAQWAGIYGRPFKFMQMVMARERGGGKGPHINDISYILRI